jgi:hypothetical protein
MEPENMNQRHLDMLKYMYYKKKRMMEQLKRELQSIKEEKLRTESIKAGKSRNFNTSRSTSRDGGFMKS